MLGLQLTLVLHLVLYLKTSIDDFVSHLFFILAISVITSTACSPQHQLQHLQNSRDTAPDMLEIFPSRYSSFSSHQALIARNTYDNVTSSILLIQTIPLHITQNAQCKQKAISYHNIFRTILHGIYFKKRTYWINWWFSKMTRIIWLQTISILARVMLSDTTLSEPGLSLVNYQRFKGNRLTLFKRLHLLYWQYSEAPKRTYL